MLLFSAGNRRGPVLMFPGHRSVSLPPQRGGAGLRRLPARLLQPAERDRVCAVSEVRPLSAAALLPVLTRCFYLSSGVTATPSAPPTASVTSSRASASVSRAWPASAANAANSTSLDSALLDANVRRRDQRWGVVIVKRRGYRRGWGQYEAGGDGVGARLL